MLIVGLTGSIGMGKSAVAARFRAHGIAVCDADALVHTLYEAEGVPLIEAAFPGVTVGGRVDRERLTQALLAAPEGFAQLEAIVHPLVRKAERRFLQREAGRGARVAVLEIPLLFETGGDAWVDVTVVVSARPDVQRARVLARPGMTEEKLVRLLARQIPDVEKRARADYVVDTNGPITDTEAQVDALAAALECREGTAYERFWKEP